MKSTENQRVKALRETLKLSQGNFGTASGLSYSLISKIEAGAEPTEKAKTKICDTFNVNSVWLNKGSGEMFKTGTLQENIDNAKALLKNHGSVVNPYENALYIELKEEITYLRELLKMAVGGKGATANFKQALENAGVPSYLLNIEGTYSGAQVEN